MDRQPSDTELAARVALLGDRRAFDRLVCRHQSRLRRFFMAQTLGDAQLSDDLAQDTFVKAYLGLAGFRGLSSFSTWLFRIACRVLCAAPLSTSTGAPDWRPAPRHPTRASALTSTAPWHCSAPSSAPA